MPSKVIHTEIEGQRLKLSNLDKIICPSAGITKAELIQYYITVGPLILNYIKDRPLTLIRFPDGVDGKQFYSKSKPDWSPEWINSYALKHTEETVHYVVANNLASVVWLANLAALEIHPMQFLISNENNPDHFIFDLDPPLGSNFQDLKHIAFKLKAFLEKYNYNPYVKTSGSKGLHIFVPIISYYNHDEMVSTVKKLAKLFVSENPDTTTIELSKAKRQGKTLIDIFRNHKAHTTVAPYSLRGKPGAPISFPIRWDSLNAIADSQTINLKNYSEFLSNGDPWLSFYHDATELHDKSS